MKMNQVDLEQYLPYMEEYDMTHQQKLEFLATFRDLLAQFVDAAFEPLPESEENERAA